MSGAVPPPAARPLERAARVPRPVCPGCGRCGRGDPAPAPQRAPLRAGVARCGGGGRASLGGVPSTIVRGVWCQALSLSRAPVLWSGQPGFRDPSVPGAVGAGVGTQHRPHSERPCGPASLAVGVAEGGPRGGCFPPLCEGRLRSGAVPPPTARPLDGLLGSAIHVRGCVGVGVQHRRLGLHALWGLRAAGPGGGPSLGGVACHRCEGRLVSGAVPPPAARPLERAARVPLPVCPGCGWCGRGDPAPAPQRAPLRAGVARCGGGGRASPGEGAFHHCEGHLRSGAVPLPTAHPLGGLLGSATHVLWARVCVCGGPALSPWPACPVGTACRWSGGGPSLGGLACHRCEGRLVSRAVAPPAARPLERAARVPRPVCPGCGRCGCGDPGPGRQRAPLQAGVARCGGGGRASPGGDAFHHCVRGV